MLHLFRARAASALMTARSGKVSLRLGHANDARSLAADAGLGNVAASDVTHIGEWSD